MATEWVEEEQKKQREGAKTEIRKSERIKQLAHLS